jgi:uroporphyrin-III C-methyltransferase/precorrin-2 dehydrogenase/sirohydrochlorin ferrochelatase
MAAKTLPALVDAALTAGADPATPAVAVVSATRADERVIVARIADLPARLAAEPPHAGPVVVMVGRVFDQLQSEASAASLPPMLRPLPLAK